MLFEPHGRRQVDDSFNQLRVMKIGMQFIPAVEFSLR